jgi:SAM-dependent methyltransferase
MQRGMTILDVGCGTGFLTIELAQRCGPQTQVVAVDVWPAAIERLRRKLAHLRLVNVRLIEQDAATIDLPDASIDLVVSNLGINNFDNPNAVLAQCLRVMKPQARLLLTTNLVGHMQEFYDVFRATLLKAGMRTSLAGFDAHVAHRATVASVTELLAGAGFESIAATTGSLQMRFADGSSMLRHHFIRLGFLPAWKALLPPESVEPFFRILERNLNVAASDQGELSLTIPMACIEARKPAERGG